jgi:hypothetical protein
MIIWHFWNVDLQWNTEILGEKPSPVAFSKLNFLNYLFLSCYPKYAFLMFRILSACAAHVILPDLIAILISRKDYGL